MSKQTQPRPPIVTIMGHVDHGKTTLLDTIRHSHVTQSEAGGITQHIGAYQITHQGHKITFIDTPGHAAFTKMRARGADVTDICILVVAADDGVKPQTIESIKHIQKSQVSCIVAINKIDKPGASPDMVKSQLTEHQLFVEGYGGQIPVVEISAIKGQGIDQLLELISLMAELEAITADPQAPLEAVVIESQLDKHQGPSASVIVKQGTLSQGDSIYDHQGNVHTARTMHNSASEVIAQALPGDPVKITGFKVIVPAGITLTHQADTARNLNQVAPSKQPDGTNAEHQLELLINADTKGTLEAIQQSISQAEVNIIAANIGPVTESDVLLAHTTKASIIAFNVKVMPAAKRLAQIESISIKQFKIIYKLIEYVEEQVLTLIEPTINEIELGQAKVIQRFAIKGENIAGCEVISGKIQKSQPVHLLRKDKIIHEATIKSLKQGKEDVKVVKAGQSCGIIFSQNIDFKTGDVLQSYKIDK